MDPERTSRLREVKQSITSNDLFDNVLTLAMYSAASFVFFILFHLSAARYLGPEQYSVLGVFASILFTVVLLSSTAYLIITRFITYHHTRYQYEQINYLVSTSLKYFFASGFLVFLIILIFAEPIAMFFNINSIGPVVMLGFAIWLQLMVPIYEGAFKGLENLHAMGRMRVFESLSRLAIVLIFAYIGLSVTSMVFALGAGTFVALAISYVPIRDLQRLHMVRPNMKEIWEYARSAVFITLPLALLLNMDIILVKHYFPPDQAGIYAAASLMAKIPFIFSWVFSSVIFPRVTKLYVDGRPTTHLLRSSLKWMVSIVFICTFVAVFFSNRIFAFMFGSLYTPSYYMGPYAFAMGLLAIVNILAVYQLALKRFTLAKVIPWFVLVELILFSFFHSTIFEIVAVTVLVTSLMVAAALYVLRHELQLEYLFNE